MRMVRLSLLGTVMLALLGGLAGVAAAQDEEAAPEAPAAMAQAVFTGEATCEIGLTEGEWTTSDPRATGPCLLTPTSWGDPIPGAVGDYTVNGPEGDRTGTWLLMPVDSQTGRSFMALEGTGAYEGWAVLAWAGTPDGWQDGDPFDLDGVIYEGSAPRLEWSEPPTE